MSAQFKVFTCTCGSETANKTVYSNLVSVIFKSLKIRNSLEISIKCNTKTLCTFLVYFDCFFFGLKLLENIAAYKQIKAWNVINHNYIFCSELVP